LFKYQFTPADFKKSFQFAVEYHLDPKHGQTGRTSAEPRGLGGVLDAFTRGKLVEIGIAQMIHSQNRSKVCELDFEMHGPHEVRNDPDIVGIIESGLSRDPNLFIEIKNTLPNDRYIGVTEEQLSSIKQGAGGKQISNVFASITPDIPIENPRRQDFVGMYLKHLTGHSIFEDFAELKASAALEFIVTLDDLERFGTKFPAGELFLETNMFNSVGSIFKTDGALRKNIDFISKYTDFDSVFNLRLMDDKEYLPYGRFNVMGSFNIYKKTNPKSVRYYIKCIADTTISNNVFGKYELTAGETYIFNLMTVGIDPTLKRNNIFIAKRRIYQLIEAGNIIDPKQMLIDIAGKI